MSNCGTSHSEVQIVWSCRKCFQYLHKNLYNIPKRQTYCPKKTTTINILAVKPAEKNEPFEIMKTLTVNKSLT